MTMMMRRVLMRLVCTRCGAEEKSTRRSEDKMEEDLTHLGWMTGLPKKQKWCPRCATEPYVRRTVAP
jgi:hypothetical protein